MFNFKTAFDRLTTAYIRGEVDPYSHCGCFCGNLLNRNEEWNEERDYYNDEEIGKDYEHITVMKDMDWSDTTLIEKVLQEETDSFYTPEDIDRLERTFVFTYEKEGGFRYGGLKSIASPINEEALYKAFELTLILLQEIHESKGEDVETFAFTKRQLQTV